MRTASNAPRIAPSAWQAARDEYVTGDKSLAQIAKGLGVTVRAVEHHACNRAANGGRTWTEWRRQFQAETTSEKADALKRVQVVAAVSVAMQHATILAALARQAADAIQGALAACEPKDKIRLALAIIAMERRVHGLDRVPLQLEVTGKDGGRIEHDVDVEHSVDDAGVAAAHRMLEAVFGGLGLG